MAAALATIPRGHQILVGDESACMFMLFVAAPKTFLDCEVGFCGLPSTHLATGTGKAYEPAVNARVALTTGLCADHAAHVRRCPACRRVVASAVPWEEVPPTAWERAIAAANAGWEGRPVL